MGAQKIFSTVKEPKRLEKLKLWKIVRRKLELLDSVVNLYELKIPPGKKLEALKGGRAEQYSIRIDNQYRICFKWQEQGPADVEIIDRHKG